LLEIFQPMMFKGHKQTMSAGHPNGEWRAGGVVSFGLNACPFSLSENLQLSGDNCISQIKSAQQRNYRPLQ
jgi:hypothetical protein